ncbi:MAG: SDR family NAD(P)-dependent oxidoreductase [Atopobiaceae bacterium]|nr:SDR family NAD(P)-dependent oxidoreductase [Atopobiaceae bacterium]
MAKTWIITGCSAGGIGEGIARAVLEHGDNAVVTARTPEKVQGIVDDYPEQALAVALDLGEQASIDACYEAAVERFGQVDVLVNNAGYCYRSSVEEADPAGVQAMFDANFFGMVAMIKKVLPAMRERKDGAIVNVSSIGAVRTGAASGYYAATKAAVELMTEGLRAEVAPLGIKAMIVEPGAFRTHFYDTSLKGSENTVGDYAETAHKRSVAQNVNMRQQPGDPLKAGYPIIKAIEADDTPLRLYLGSDALAAVRGALNARLEELEKWAEVSKTTDFDA